tara:strand:- start:814 stop:1182 length:369 start_codon:yes stop_codon:yes gene_type:complete
MAIGSKRNLLKLIVIRLLIVFVFYLCVLLSLNLWKHFNTMQDAALKRSEIEQERSVLENKKAELEKKIEYLSSDASFEAKIRENFDMIKEGEQVVVIVGEVNEETSEEAPLSKQKKWYHFWR